jgi:glycosyltransferase involved in cell wall biosynthesis
MQDDHPLPLSLRSGVLRSELRRAIVARRPRIIPRAIRSFVAPARWPPPARVIGAVLDRAVARGSVPAARRILAILDLEAEAHRPGTPAAVRRATAMDVAAPGLPDGQRQIERVVAAYLRGELGPPRKPAPPEPGELVDRVAAVAEDLRREGQDRPTIVMTFPGFHTNPYARLMEQAYREHGLVAVPVDDPAAIDAIVDAQERAGYRVIAHLNAPDRFVLAPHTGTEPRAIADEALGRVDGWLAHGVGLVVSVHNRPRLTGRRGEAEQLVAQGILDRAHLVHLLAATTPELLGDWVRIDPARSVHVPHPNYDGVYPPPPDRASARRALGIPGGVPESDTLVVGLVGALADRKGGLALVEALRDVPDPLPDGRHLHLLVGGMLIGARSEELIRSALGRPRVTCRFGFVPDDAVPTLLASLDVAVVPYGTYLNSGWLHLALTFGLPVISGADGTASEVVRPEALRLFTGDDRASLAAALAGAGDLATESARLAARASIAGLDARELSERFVREMLAAIPDGRSATAPTP